MTSEEKELISTIKIAVIRGIVFADEEKLLELIKTAVGSNMSENPTGSTTKNNLAVDTIDRVELLRAMDTWDKFGFTTRYGLERLDKDDKGFVPYVKYDDMLKCVKGMSSVTPKGVTVTDFADKCRECGARIGGGIRNGFDNSNNCNSSSTFVGNN